MNGVTYYYIIAAQNAKGNGVNSSEANGLPATTPNAPQSASATSGDTQVTLSWSAPSSNGGLTITSYNIYRSNTSGSGYLYIGTNSSATGYVDTDRINGNTYYYVITAVNSFGESSNSAEVNAQPAKVPDAPTGLSVSAGNTQLTLTWSAPSDGPSWLTSMAVEFRRILKGFPGRSRAAKLMGLKRIT